MKDLTLLENLLQVMINIVLMILMNCLMKNTKDYALMIDLEELVNIFVIEQVLITKNIMKWYINI